MEFNDFSLNSINFIPVFNPELNTDSGWVRTIGLEPTRRKTPDPKSGAATNYATCAFARAKLLKITLPAKFIDDFFIEII